ncbi:DHA2 family efflux MFS transporter permease subunit [Streptomyces sp. NPDC002262]|uniref:DHA2 family efflux MFS transporter permease subunit n=1 Tax=Streptomyces sp. NPDC002262 TaxID=3154414 RepID=UPI00332DC502
MGGKVSDRPHTPPRRTGLAWTMAVTSLAGFMASLDILIVVTALPAIRQDLGGGIEELEWTVNSYTLTFAVLLLLGAALGDRFGRRRVFVASVVLFSAASLAAALSGTTGELIAARAAQGVGAAMMAPLTLTLLTAAVPKERRGLAFGLWGAANGLALAIGPLAGGLIVEGLSWTWIFWINVPLGAVLAFLARTRLAESRGDTGRLDVVGTVLASAGLLGVVWAVIEGNAEGWTSVTTLLRLGAGAVLLAAFLGWELRAPAPMLRLGVFRDRSFGLVNAASLLMFTGLYGSLFLLTQYLQIALGHDALEAGLRTLPLSAMPVVVAPLAGALSDRFGSRPVVLAGMVCQTAGLGLLALTAGPEGPYSALVVPLVLTGTGMALFFSPVASLVMSRVPEREQGVASGTNNALRQLGGVLGVALLGAVFAARGGYATPRAFTDGLTPALWTGTAFLALAAVLVAAIPRRPSPVPDGPERPGAAPAAATDPAADALNERTVRRLFDEVLNGRDLSAVDDLYHPHVVDHSPYPGAPAGRDGVRHSIRKVLASYDAPAYRLDALEARDGEVRVTVHFQGRSLRRVPGRGPKNATLHTVQRLTFRLAGGLITERLAERPVRCPDPAACPAPASATTPQEV